MQWQINPYIFPMLLSAILASLLALLAWRRRPVPGATTMTVLMLVLTAWSILYAFELAAVDLASKLFWARLQYAAFLSVPVLWLVFVLQYTNQEKMLGRRSIVFLVSDFLSDNWENAARIARVRHELVPVVVGDPLESKLPEIGIVMLEDLETGQLVELDTSGSAGQDFQRRAAAAQAARAAALRRLNVDIVEVKTNEPYVDALIAFFKARAKRMAHS